VRVDALTNDARELQKVDCVFVYTCVNIHPEQQLFAWYTNV